jgi:Lon protease-like protein
LDVGALALFPLATVLFPDGRLSLRIFETRYLNLVRDCARFDQSFGVCRLLESCGLGEPVQYAAVGCEARIIDFSALPDGLLGVTVQGGCRFRIARTQVRDDGLIVAEVERLAPTPAIAVRPEHQLLAGLLERILERAGAPHNRAEKPSFDNAEWLAWRLAEWLPLSYAVKQALLQEDDPHARLQALVEAISVGAV